MKGPYEWSRPPVQLRFAGAFAGMALALLAWWWAWAATHPDEPDWMVFQAAAESWVSLVLFVVVAAALGWFVSSRALRHPTGRRLLAPLLGITLILLGATVGFLLAIVAFVTIYIFETGGTLGEALWQMILGGQDIFSAASLMSFAGTIIGMAVAAYLFAEPLLGHFGRRFVAAIVGAVVGAIIYSFGYVLRFYREVPQSTDYLFRFGEAVTSFTAVELLTVAIGAGIGFIMGRYSWQLYGVFTLIALISVVVGYLAYTLTTTLPEVPEDHLPLSVVLFAAETASLTMVVLYSFYTLDVAARKRWDRAPDEVRFSAYYMPKVAFQVPTFNEPAEVVLDTLRSLVRMDYPKDRFIVMVADDSTDPECREPIERFCADHGLVYVHREKRGGFKAGALNNLMKHTPDDVELIAIIDADYQVDPDYLKECVGFFVDANLGWIQTPQAYRNRHQSFLTEQFFLADAFFYRTVLPSRNEENSIIFCGTMGILRRTALDNVGGWGEKYITEDAELSIRLTRHGYDSLYINKTYGRGLIPPTFDGYKKQQYRWAFGGAKIFRGYFLRIVFGRFTPRQAIDHIVGTIHWFEGLFVLSIGAIIFSLAMGELFNFQFVIHHDEEILLVGLVPMFILADGVTRLHMVLRRNLGLRFFQTLGVMGMWFSVKFSNMRAALKALIGFNMPFVRTPKGPDESIGQGEALRRAFQVSRFETFFAVLFWGAAVAIAVKLVLLWGADRTLTRGLLALWLTYYALVFSAAPVYAYKSYVTFRPDVAPETPPPQRVRATAH